MYRAVWLGTRYKYQVCFSSCVSVWFSLFSVVSLGPQSLFNQQGCLQCTFGAEFIFDLLRTFASEFASGNECRAASLLIFCHCLLFIRTGDGLFLESICLCVLVFVCLFVERGFLYLACLLDCKV